MPDPQEINWPGARALVVDDDEAVNSYVSTLLKKHGIQTDEAHDGLEGEAFLRANRYHLLFLDLDLPGFSGKFILELIKRGKAHRPLWVVVMSGAPTIAQKIGDDWTRLGITDFLAKPFGAADLQAFLDRTLDAFRQTQTGPTPLRSVLLAGAGDWAGAILRLVKRAGGAPNAVQTHEDLTKSLAERPGVVIVGPPFDGGGIVQACVIVRAMLPGTEILVATDVADSAALRADLLRIGVVRTIQLPAGLSWLAGETVRVAGLAPRMARAPLPKPILLRGSDGIVGAVGEELFESGLAVKVAAGIALPSAPLVAEFELPGEDRLVEATLESDWNRTGPDGSQFGLRFVGMTEADQERVRNYLLLNDRD